MATFPITAAGSVGLTDGSFAAAKRAALLAVASIGLTCVPVVHNTQHKITSTSSIGLSNAGTITYFNQSAHGFPITGTLSIGLSSSVTPHMGRKPVGVGSIGISAASTITYWAAAQHKAATSTSSMGLSATVQANVVRNGTASGSVGLSSASMAGYLASAHLFPITVTASLGISSPGAPTKLGEPFPILFAGTLGLSGSVTPNVIRNIVGASASVGLSSSGNAGAKRASHGTGSIGITGSGSPGVNHRCGGTGPIGLSAKASAHVGRSISTLGHLGLTSLSRFVVLPTVPVGAGGIILFEATDGAPNSTYAEILPRSSLSILRDTTRSIYPNPYTLIN